MLMGTFWQGVWKIRSTYYLFDHQTLITIMKVNALISALALTWTLIVQTSCQKDIAMETTATSETKQIRSFPTQIDPNLIPETQPANQTAVTVNIGTNVGGLYKALPNRYDSTSKKYPLIIFIHGVGELGNGTTQLSKVLVNGIPKLLNARTFPARFSVGGENHSFIVVSPQFKQWPVATDVNAVINWAVANLRVDESRIYVSGLSMGGGIAWEYAIAYPNRIAAVVPMCGAAWPTQVQCGNMAAANLPIWAFHNNDDGTVGAGITNMIIDFTNSFGPNPMAQKTIWPSGGHDCWTKASNPSTRECNGKNMYEWMLQYKR